jgi:sulfite reductase (NADPH) flavoprotein alpha-component
MNSPVRIPIATILPPNAPFTPEQHDWLNGFFAGLLEGQVAALSPEESAAPAPPTAKGDDDGAPWHDQTLPLAERMKLAEGRPQRPGLIAARDTTARTIPTRSSQRRRSGSISACPAARKPPAC